LLLTKRLDVAAQNGEAKYQKSTVFEIDVATIR
jgi:hypothetical protein